MPEYYKTPGGYYYKKTQKGGLKRISEKDYNKKNSIILTKSLDKNNNTHHEESKILVKKKNKIHNSNIKYIIKTNKNGNKYYIKIDKNGKQFRISKNEYNKNVLKGGAPGTKRKKPNTNNNNIKNLNALKDINCWDTITYSDNKIIDYLKDDDMNYVSKIKLSNGKSKYNCHNINYDLQILKTDYIYNNESNVPVSKRGVPILKEFYICNKYLGDEISRNILKKHTNSFDDTYIKLIPNMELIKMPSWIRNKKFPNFPDDSLDYRIFNLVKSDKKAAALVSAAMLYSTTPSSEVSVSGDHCNQLKPVDIYNFEPIKKHPVDTPSTPPTRPIPNNYPNLNRNRSRRNNQQRRQRVTSTNQNLLPPLPPLPSSSRSNNISAQQQPRTSRWEMRDGWMTPIDNTQESQQVNRQQQAPLPLPAIRNLTNNNYNSNETVNNE